MNPALFVPATRPRVFAQLFKREFHIHESKRKLYSRYTHRLPRIFLFSKKKTSSSNVSASSRLSSKKLSLSFSLLCILKKKTQINRSSSAKVAARQSRLMFPSSFPRALRPRNWLEGRYYARALDAAKKKMRKSAGREKE